MKPACKLVALDMDGTLLTSEKTVLPETLEDLRFARDAGVSLAYCTGRGLAELRSYLPRLPMLRYAICNSGSVVYDCREDRPLLSQDIPAALCREILAVAARFPCMPQFLTETESVVARRDVTHMADFHMGVYQSMYLEVTRQVDDMIAEGVRLGDISKINLYFPDQATRLQAHAALKNLPISLVLTEQTGLEMTAQSVTKASGLQHLAKLLGLSPAETAAVGDGENDREMLMWAGFSAAMGNALPEIQVLCDFVAPDNDHNGVGAALRRAIFVT